MCIRKIPVIKKRSGNVLSCLPSFLVGSGIVTRILYSQRVSAFQMQQVVAPSPAESV